jgi:hypothetical protein
MTALLPLAIMLWWLCAMFDYSRHIYKTLRRIEKLLEKTETGF